MILESEFLTSTKWCCASLTLSSLASPAFGSKMLNLLATFRICFSECTVAVFHSHQVQNVTALTPRELDIISAVFDTIVRRANLIIGRLPTWFVASSPDGARRSSVYGGEEACVRQAAALATLHNPHVRKFFGGCHVGSPFVLQEEDWVGPSTWSFCSDCAVGLDYIHRHGFIHKEMKDETLRYNKTAKRVILSGMGLVSLQDGTNQNDTSRALQADIVSFGKVIYSALARSRGYDSLACGSELPHDKPDFVKEEEWSLLLSFGAVDSLSDLVKRMRDLDKNQRIEELLAIKCNEWVVFSFI